MAYNLGLVYMFCCLVPLLTQLHGRTLFFQLFHREREGLILIFVFHICRLIVAQCN